MDFSPECLHDAIALTTLLVHDEHGEAVELAQGLIDQGQALPMMAASTTLTEWLCKTLVQMQMIQDEHRPADEVLAVPKAEMADRMAGVLQMMASGLLRERFGTE